MMRIQPKNWEDFQHYKDRSPIWIKLHRKLLDDYEFHCLPVASRALAPLLWLLSSEYPSGVIDAPTEKVSFRVRMTPKELDAALSPLISSGFFIMYQDASEVIAEGYQGASLEKRREEKEKKFTPPTFDEVDAYCKERNKGVDPRRFFDHYSVRGWVPKGYKVQMKDWKAAVRTWEKNEDPKRGPQLSAVN